MGQKTHPIGLRVGIYRKWSSTWYGCFQEKQSRLMPQFTFPAKGTFVPRSVNYISGRQDFLESLIRRYSRTQLYKSCRILPVDFRLYKGVGGYMYGFLVYLKLESKR